MLTRKVIETLRGISFEGLLNNARALTLFKPKYAALESRTNENVVWKMLLS